MDIVEPVGERILVRKDDDKKKTSGGIILPDESEIPVITGRVVAVSVQLERDTDFPVKMYDKVLFHPRGAIPASFEGDNKLYIVERDQVVAVFRKDEKSDG